MDPRYYTMLRQASQEDFYHSITDPEDELYDVIWDLFEKVVIEPGEVFDPEFRESNQFRYNINSVATLEFFPDSAYFGQRPEPSPYDDDSDAAGIHLQFSLLPTKSCLFSVGFQVWGGAERRAFKTLWQEHRQALLDLLNRAKPMISTRLRYPRLEHTNSLEEMLDSYFSIRDPENCIVLRYSFAREDQGEVAQTFMVIMSFLYHTIKSHCLKHMDQFQEWLARLKHVYSGHIPRLPPPLPCVDLAITTGAE